METLSLSGLIVGFPIWLFLTSVIPSVPNSTQPYFSPEQHHVDPKVNLSPSFPISSPRSSSSSGESLDSNNQVAKKKKNKENKPGEKSTTIDTHVANIEKPRTPSCRVKFPCKLCEGDHLLRDCPGIPKVL